MTSSSSPSSTMPALRPPATPPSASLDTPTSSLDASPDATFASSHTFSLTADPNDLAILGCDENEERIELNPESFVTRERMEAGQALLRKYHVSACSTIPFPPSRSPPILSILTSPVDPGDSLDMVPLIPEHLPGPFSRLDLLPGNLALTFPRGSRTARLPAGTDIADVNPYDPLFPFLVSLLYGFCHPLVTYERMPHHEFDEYDEVDYDRPAVITDADVSNESRVCFARLIL